MHTADRKNALRRGSCPGVYTPMESGDGLLVRVRAATRVLTRADLRALAELAARHGNGLLELTRRANVQLRGVRELAALQAGLVAAGLADADPAREQRLAPLLVDPALELPAFEAALAECAYQPATKLAIVIEGVTPMHVDADLRVRIDGGLAHLALGDAWLGPCSLDAAPTRMTELLALFAVHGAARARELPPLERMGLTRAAPPRPLEPRPGSTFALPFGAGDAALFARLAECVEGARVTPARELILTGVSDPAALRALGLIVERDDPLRRVIACPGAPACRSAHGDTRGLGRELAPLGLSLHVSGCEKGCAGSAASEATLVRSQGGVRLAFDADVTRAAGEPVITLEEARRLLAARAAAS